MGIYDMLKDKNQESKEQNTHQLKIVTGLQGLHKKGLTEIRVFVLELCVGLPKGLIREQLILLKGMQNIRSKVGVIQIEET